MFPKTAFLALHANMVGIVADLQRILKKIKVLVSFVGYLNHKRFFKKP